MAGLKQQIESGSTVRGLDGLTAAETLRAVQAAHRGAWCGNNSLLARSTGPRPGATRHPLSQAEGLGRGGLAMAGELLPRQVRPVLTPLAIDPAHPFPQLLNKSLNIIVQLEMKTGGENLRHLAVVQVPRVLPPVVKLPRAGGGQDYVFLGEIGGAFPGGFVSRHKNPRLLAFPRHPQQRTLHR